MGGEEQWTKLHSDIAVDEHKKVDFHCMLIASMDHKKVLSDKNLNLLFKKIDMNKDGFFNITDA